MTLDYVILGIRWQVGIQRQEQGKYPVPSGSILLETKIRRSRYISGTSQVALMVKNLPASAGELRRWA